MIDEYAVTVEATGKLFSDDVFSQIQRITEKRIGEAAALAKGSIRSKIPERTGALLESIQIEGTGDSTRVFSTSHYGFFVEKGHRQGRTNVVQVAPKPFFYTTSVRRVVSKALGRILTDIAEIIQ